MLNFNRMKEILLINDGKVWITKEDWDLCQEFEREQHKKLCEFMYTNWKKDLSCDQQKFEK